MGKNLEELRKDINRIDREIVRLITERMKLSRSVGKVKAALGKKVYDPEREQEVLEKVSSRAGNDSDRKAVNEIYRTIFKVSKQVQSK